MLDESSACVMLSCQHVSAHARHCKLAAVRVHSPSIVLCALKDRPQEEHTCVLCTIVPAMQQLAIGASLLDLLPSHLILLEQPYRLQMAK